MDLRGREKIVSLHGAIMGGFFQQVRFLIELGADINARDNQGRTCLMLCSLIEDENWGVGLAMTFIEKGVKTHLRDKNGMNAFHYACLYQRPGVIRTLLAAADFDLAQPDKHGNTGLHYLATVNDVELTKTVVDAFNKYRISVDKPNKQGITPLIQAWMSDSFECGRALVSLGHADQDFTDTVHGKSAREWELEALRRVETIATRRADEAKQTVHQRLIRISSAPSRRRTRSNVADGKVLHARLPTKQDTLIRSASTSDIRNNPQYVFKLSPVDFFEKGNAAYTPNQRPKSSDYQKLLDRRNTNKSWRPEFKFLFHEFEFQCSPTYVESAKPAPPDLSAQEYTPPSSEYGGETDRSSSGRNRDGHKEKLSRKVSSSREPGKLGRSNTRADMFNKGRRLSIAPGMPAGPEAAHAAKVGAKKKPKTSTSSSDNSKDDGGDDGFTESGEPKGLPPRPVSRVSMLKP